MSRQKLVLALLLVVLAGAVWYAYWASPKQESISTTAGSKNLSKPARKGPQETPETDKRRVRLEILSRGVDAFTEPRRDIFRMVQPRSVAPAVRPVPPPPVAPPAVVPSPVAVNPMPMTPSVPPVHFTVLGTLLKDGRTTVFLSLDNEVFIVKQGDRFGKNKEFEVTEITDDKVLIERGGGGLAPITVSLQEHAPEFSNAPAASATPTSPAAPVARQVPNIRVPARRFFPVTPPPAPTDTSENEEPPAEPDQPAPEFAPPEDPPPQEPAPDNAANGNMSSLQLRSMIQ